MCRGVKLGNACAMISQSFRYYINHLAFLCANPFRLVSELDFTTVQKLFATLQAQDQKLDQIQPGTSTWTSI